MAATWSFNTAKFAHHHHRLITCTGAVLCSRLYLFRTGCLNQQTTSANFLTHARAHLHKFYLRTNSRTAFNLQQKVRHTCYKLGLGFTSGTLASIANIPYDVAKSRIQGPQLADASGKLKYRGAHSTMLIIYKEEGSVLATGDFHIFSLFLWPSVSAIFLKLCLQSALEFHINVVVAGVGVCLLRWCRFSNHSNSNLFGPAQRNRFFFKFLLQNQFVLSTRSLL